MHEVRHKKKDFVIMARIEQVYDAYVWHALIKYTPIHVICEKEREKSRHLLGFFCIFSRITWDRSTLGFELNVIPS